MPHAGPWPPAFPISRPPTPPLWAVALASWGRARDGVAVGCGPCHCVMAAGVPCHGVSVIVSCVMVSRVRVSVSLCHAVCHGVPIWQASHVTCVPRSHARRGNIPARASRACVGLIWPRPHIGPVVGVGVGVVRPCGWKGRCALHPVGSTGASSAGLWCGHI